MPAGSESLALHELKDRLQALFTRFGAVRRLDLVRADQGSVRQVMCFVRMSQPEEEQVLVQALGMGRFGGDLVMVIALDDQVGTEAPWIWHDRPPRATPAGWR